MVGLRSFMAMYMYMYNSVKNNMYSLTKLTEFVELNIYQ